MNAQNTYDYIYTYAQAFTHALNSIFQSNYTLSHPFQYEPVQQLKSLNRFWGNISYYGRISGDFYCSLNKADLINCLDEKNSSRMYTISDLSDYIKETMNMAAGKAICRINEDFGKNDIVSPKIIQGTIKYSKSNIVTTSIAHSSLLPIDLFICINQMSLST